MTTEQMFEVPGSRLLELTDRIAVLGAALQLIAANGCETFTRGSCRDSGRTPDAEYGADRWCDACIARAGLDGDLPVAV